MITYGVYLPVYFVAKKVWFYFYVCNIIIPSFVIMCLHVTECKCCTILDVCHSWELQLCIESYAGSAWQGYE